MPRIVTPGDTDAYKIGHWLQRPSNITKFYSYGEPRVGGKNKFICFFGLQPIIQEHFLPKITTEMIEEAQEECFMTFGTDKLFNREVWQKVRDFGYLPLKIMAVPEGTIVEEGNVCFTIESTEPWFANMISHFEDFLMWPWYSSAVCTRSMNIKKAIKPIFEQTSDIPELVLPFAVNDFGLRGATFFQGAIMGGMAHLVHFEGSDNMPASRHIKDYYGMKGRAKSVWATEHSVECSYGPGKGEYEYVKAQLSVHTDLIKSIVIDAYDADNFMQNVVGSDEIKELVKAHKGRIVWRPDSGKPLLNVTKYSDMLGAIFGFDMNNKQYKVLKYNTGLIQGDGMDEYTVPELFKEYVKTGWSAENIVTGSGGGLLEESLTRDTQRWAIKLSYMEKDGVPFNVMKSPKTDPTKNSKSGMLKLHSPGTTISSKEESPQMFAGYTDMMKVVYENGKFNKDRFENIIERASRF